MRGKTLLKRDPADVARAETALLRAIEIAGGQRTRAFGLRAALSLAKLYQSTGRPTDAYAVLAPRSKASPPRRDAGDRRGSGAARRAFSRRIGTFEQLRVNSCG